MRLSPPACINKEPNRALRKHLRKPQGLLACVVRHLLSGHSPPKTMKSLRTGSCFCNTQTLSSEKKNAEKLIVQTFQVLQSHHYLSAVEFGRGAAVAA